MAKWAKAGFPIAIVDGLVNGLELDRRESTSRAPRKSGRLAATIRVVKPSATAAARRGFITAALAAGSKSGDRRKAVSYGRVHQVGGFTGPHRIRARAAQYVGGRLVSGVMAMKIGGRTVFAPQVFHPGSKFRKLEYLKITEPRVAYSIDRSIQGSADREVA